MFCFPVIFCEGCNIILGNARMLAHRACIMSAGNRQLFCSVLISSGMYLSVYHDIPIAGLLSVTCVLNESM